MQPPPLKLTATPEDLRIAWLAALAISIHVLESAFPSPLPGVKPGLANVITIMGLILFGWRTAVAITLLRVIAGSLFVGSFLTPTFLLSLAGAVAALGAMGLVWRVAGKAVSAVGLSLVAALAHMSGQFVTAYLLFIPHEALWRLYPVLMSVSLIFGLVSGTIAAAIIRKIHVTAA